MQTNVATVLTSQDLPDRAGGPDRRHTAGEGVPGLHAEQELVSIPVQDHHRQAVQGTQGDMPSHPGLAHSSDKDIDGSLQ